MRKWWILDAGHGGILDGKYTTAPAKMFTFPDGLVVYEGVVNRGIAWKLAKMLDANGIDWSFVHDEEIDTPLPVRVRRANEIYTKRKNAVMLSIHSNAGGGKGNEVFTSKGETKADPIAEIFCKKYIEHFPEWPFRSDKSDGDLDKEADFFVLKHTLCPAILVESFFFDERKQAELLLSEAGQIKIAYCLLQSIKQVENEKDI
jgi:N-acetylmuramoyl-L-alanine amidase